MKPSQGYLETMAADLYKSIYDDLLKHRDKKKIVADSRYHKYDGYNSFGIKSAVRKEIFRKYRKEIKQLSCREVLVLAKKLAARRIEDATLAGNFVLQNRPECPNKDILPSLDKYLNNFRSWSTTDDFCINVLQPTLMKNPKETLHLLGKWNRSKNMWKRRASVVVFVRKIGQGGRFTNEALKLCNGLIWDKEDLVQKGVGWCLKDVMRGDKKKVLAYVEALRKKGVPAVITLYAIRGIKGPERSRILAV